MAMPAEERLDQFERELRDMVFAEGELIWDCLVSPNDETKGQAYGVLALCGMTLEDFTREWVSRHAEVEEG